MAAATVSIVLRVLRQDGTRAHHSAVIGPNGRLKGLSPRHQQVLFGLKGNLGDVEWTELATQVDMRNASEFTECLSSSTSQEMLNRDLQIADRLHLNATPVLLINGRVVIGEVSRVRLQSLINR